MYPGASFQKQKENVLLETHYKCSLSVNLLTGSCAVLGLGGRAVDPASSLAPMPSLEVFLRPSILACWALAAWVFTDWRS